MDIHTKQTRSYNMGQIKSTNTVPELLVRGFLHKNGFRYALHSKDLPGKPDIVLRKYKTAIFINGCFRHCHKNCKYASIPKSNIEFWSDKLTKNKENDMRNYKLLKSSGRNVIVIRGCELKRAKLEITLNKLLKKLIIIRDSSDF